MSIALLGNHLLIREEESSAVIWLNSRFRTNLLGIRKLTVIWLDSRFYSNSLGIVENSTGEAEITCYLVGLQVSQKIEEVKLLSGLFPGFTTIDEVKRLSGQIQGFTITYMKLNCYLVGFQALQQLR